MKFIVSSISGRMRIRNPKLRGDIPRLKALEQALKACDSSCRVASNPACGSLLVIYDAKRTSRAQMESVAHQTIRGTFGWSRGRHHYTPTTLKLNRYAKYGMFSSLALTLWLAAARAKRPHAVHRHRLLS